MKIAYLCSDVDIPLLGNDGCSIHIRQFADALVEDGHDVFIVCASLGKSSHASTRARVYHLEPTGLDASGWASVEQELVDQNANLERDLRSVAFNFWAKSEGRAILERECPDFIYERYALFGWAGVEWSRQLGIPLIMELNAPLCRQQAGYEKFVLTETAARMEREILRRPNALIALTGWLRDWAVALGAEASRVHVIPDGVNDRLFGAEVSAAGVRSRLGLEGKRVVGHLGRFKPWHDVQGLFEAFGALHRRDQDARLLLVGDGPQRRRLEETVRQLGLEGAVVFAGNVPHERVPEYVRAMDVAVVPYRNKPDFFFSPLKLFECMAVGVPTVAAALGQIEEVIEHGRTGWLYPAGDNQRLAEGIATLLDDVALARRVGQAARATVLRDYTWRGVTRRVTALAEQLIGDRPQSRRSTVASG